jgi:hypothetical protein
VAERKLIELLIDPEAQAFGVEAISLVKYPAIERNFIYFSKQGKSQLTQLAAIDEEKQTLIGPALIPDKHIPRLDEGSEEEYDVFFSKETVRQCAELFLKENRANSHTFEHQVPIDGVSVVESWLVVNPELDKAKHYGLSVPEGTWMVRVHCANEDMWSKVKEGELRGFSIEGYFADKILKAQKENLFARLMKTLRQRKFYAEATLADGKVVATEAEKLEPGVAVFTLDAEGMPVPMSNGKYTTKAGVELEVFDGILTDYDGEVQEVIESEPAEPKPASEKVDLWKKYFEKRYNQMKKVKMSRRQFAALADKAIIWIRPLGVDVPDQLFYPFKYGSYDEYAQAVQDRWDELSNQYGELVEESEVVDYEYIPAGSVDSGMLDGMSEDQWEGAKVVMEIADEEKLDYAVVEEVLMEAGESWENARDWWQEHVVYRGQMRDYIAELIDQGNISDEQYDAYFNYASFGNDLKQGGDITEMLADIGDPEISDEVNRMSNEQVAMWYMDQEGIGNPSELGAEALKNYFDEDMFAQDLRDSYSTYGTGENAIVVIL